jgi:hypothetical protein
MSSDPSTDIAGKRITVRRFIPLLILLAGLVLFFATGLNQYLSFEALGEHREWLNAQVERYGVLAGVVFMVIYAVVIAFSIPGGAALTIVGGFLFGTLATTVYVRCAARQGRAGFAQDGAGLQGKRAQLPPGAPVDSPGAILDSGEQPDLTVIFNTEVLIPILGLAVLSLLPVLYKLVKARRGGGP